MFIDILMAFVMAMIIEMFALCNKYFKQIAIFTCCLTIVIIYFVNGYQIDFIGKIDFAIWIIFIIMFDMVLVSVLRKFDKQIKE